MLAASRGLEDALEVSARTAPVAIAGPVSALSQAAVRQGGHRRGAAGVRGRDRRSGRRPDRSRADHRDRQAGRRRAGRASALAEILARDVAARREIEADRAQHRTTIKWIVVFISGFTLFAIVNRSYSAPYGTVLGEAVLAFVALLYTVGLAWLHRLGTIPAPGRFLDQTPARIAPAGLASAGLASAGLASAGLASAGMPGGTVDPYLARGGQYLARGGLAGSGALGYGPAGYDAGRSGPVGYGPSGASVFDSGPAGLGLPGAGMPSAGMPGSGSPGSGSPGSGSPGSGAPGRSSRRRNWPGSGTPGSGAQGKSSRRRNSPGSPRSADSPSSAGSSRRATCLGGAARGRVAARAGAARTRAAPGRWAPGPRVLALGDPVRRMPGRQSRARVRQIPRS